MQHSRVYTVQTKGGLPVEIRVGQRSQVVIPLELRRRMGVRDGDMLHAQLDDNGRLVLEKVESDPLLRLIQAGQGLFAGQDAVAYQRFQRDDGFESAPA